MSAWPYALIRLDLFLGGDVDDSQTRSAIYVADDVGGVGLVIRQE